MNISILCALFNMSVMSSHKPSKELELMLTSSDFIAHLLGVSALQEQKQTGCEENRASS